MAPTKMTVINQADPRVKRTRKLLTDAFMELMFEKSFQSISVHDIAERATVNRATFYAHFVDKHAILDQVAGDLFRDRLTRRVSFSSPLSPTNLHVLVVAVLEALGDFRSRCKPTDRDVEPVIESRMQLELEAFILSWLERLPVSDVEQRAARETAATMLSWAIFGAGIEWSRGDRALSADARAQQVVALLTGGLGSILNMPAQEKGSEKWHRWNLPATS